MLEQTPGIPEIHELFSSRTLTYFVDMFHYRSLLTHVRCMCSFVCLNINEPPLAVPNGIELCSGRAAMSCALHDGGFLEWLNQDRKEGFERP